MKNRGIVDIDFGLEIIEGLMGSGKSYFAVRRLCKVIETDRRAVYTNLPLRWRVVRQYLRNRGGEQLAGLIHQLDEAHWRRFLKRQHRYAKFLEALKVHTPQTLTPKQLQEISAATGEAVQKIAAQPKVYTRQYEAWFNSLNGEPVTQGPEADHIPPTSVIIIDEVQHWHPMSKQNADQNGDDLLAYLTMCRHHLHWIWVITQDSTRIAKVFRLLFKYNWRVWDRGEDRVAWSIRLKHLGIRAMGYERYTPDQLDNSNFEERKPSDRFTILSKMPKNQVYYRLYDSFTNIADKRSLALAQRKNRTIAGLANDGQTEKERQQQQEEDMPNKPGFIKRVRRLIRKAITLVILISLAYSLGTIGKTKEIQSAEPIVENKPIEWPSWNAAGTQPYFNGRPYSEGEQITDGVRLAYYAPDRRSLVCAADGAWWVWLYGEPEPRRVGTFDTVRDAVQATRDGQPEPGPSEEGP